MTTTATHPTHAALLEAIRAEPADDTVRLALADWYEENGDPAWAELIHVQVELARQRSYEPIADTPREVDALWKKRDREIDALSARSDALLREHEPRWRRGAKCERCENGTYTFFPSTSHPPRKKTCPFCHGTGWTNWALALSARCDHDGTVLEWRHRVHFDRGFITQVDAPLADIFNGNQATEWALACVRGEPGLRRFGVVDRPAWQSGIDGKWVCFGSGRLADDFHEDLGEPLLSAMDQRPDRGRFDSPAAANTAIATAAYQRVREQAGSGSNGGG